MHPPVGAIPTFCPLSDCGLALDFVTSPQSQTLLSQIEKADLRDEGVYTCSATNLAGESKKNVTLKVLGEDRSSMGSKAWGDWVTPQASLEQEVEGLDSQLCA